MVVFSRLRRSMAPRAVVSGVPCRPHYPFKSEEPLMLMRIWTAMRRIDDSWIGDLIGAALLVVMFWALMLLVAAFQPVLP